MNIRYFWNSVPPSERITFPTIQRALGVAARALNYPDDVLTLTVRERGNGSDDPWEITLTRKYGHFVLFLCKEL